MRVINVTNSVTWVDCPGGGWENPSAYQAEAGVVIDTRLKKEVGSLENFLLRATDAIVVVTREVAATIEDPNLLQQVRVPGAAAMKGGGFYAEPFNPHAQ